MCNTVIRVKLDVLVFHAEVSSKFSVPRIVAALARVKGRYNFKREYRVMSRFYSPEILTISQMYAADEAARSHGVSGYDLMEAAGASVAREIQKRWASRRVTVLCGPGNNGGDGFVVGRYLLSAGWDVTIAQLSGQENISG